MPPPLTPRVTLRRLDVSWDEKVEAEFFYRYAELSLFS
jgi:hypothetical protein